MKYKIITVLLAVMALPLWAKVDLVTLPKRESVQLTIYNSADLTLVREVRQLTLKKGDNQLQFSWANTLIDPTSLSMTPKEHADKIDVVALVYPPRVQGLGVWTIRSEVSGKVPFEITYLTSGISWRAFYMGTMVKDETTMRLQGYVVVTNNSGEDYEDAQTRLIVGKVNLIDQIAMLAQRQYPYDRPRGEMLRKLVLEVEEEAADELAMPEAPAEAPPGAGGGIGRPKEIKKEGLSEYFLYTIEGTETIPTGWSKRLPSFDVSGVPVVNLYKYEEERYGNQCVRFLSFKNDKEHKLGETPIPGGLLKVYRSVDDQGHLSYEGQSGFKYIPVEEDVELNLGPVTNVIVEPKLMTYATDRYSFNQWGDIDGWDEINEFQVEVKNTRDVNVKVEITRNFPHQYWDLDRNGEIGTYEKIDLDTVRFTNELKPRTKQVFTYTLTKHEGRRRE